MTKVEKETKIKISVGYEESETIGWECQNSECSRYFNEDEDGCCPHCGDEDPIPEWNWEGVTCAMGCGYVGNPDEDFGTLSFLESESEGEFKKLLTQEQVITLGDYGEMICKSCATALNNHTHNDEIEIETLLEFFH